MTSTNFFGNSSTSDPTHRLQKQYFTARRNGTADAWLSKQTSEQLDLLFSTLIRSAEQQGDASEQFRLGHEAADSFIRANDYKTLAKFWYELMFIEQGHRGPTPAHDGVESALGLPDQKLKWFEAISQFHVTRQNEEEEAARQQEKQQREDAERKQLADQLRQQARARYPGSDAEFETAWDNGLREQMYANYATQDMSASPWDEWRRETALKHPLSPHVFEKQ